MLQYLACVYLLNVLIIVTPDRDEFLVLLHSFQILLRFLDLLLTYRLHRFQQTEFLALAQQPHCLAVFLFQRGEQCTAERLHVVAYLVGLLQQDVEAIERERSVQVGESATDIHASSDGFHQSGGVDGRLEQRQLTHHALDVHAVAYFMSRSATMSQ